MYRLLIVCIDGTWNSNEERYRTFSKPTNVQRISRLLEDNDDGYVGRKGFVPQRVLYRPGVGTQGFVDRVVGGVWGTGSIFRVCDGYRFLCENYMPGDEIAFFGFSRGAFAVRSIIGVLTNLGVLRADRAHFAPEAVSLTYRERSENHSADWKRLFAFAKEHCHAETPNVRFVGLWDTVIRYGPLMPPFKWLLRSATKRHFGLFDHQAPPCVKKVCHALALDERRAAFWPWRFEKRLFEKDLDVWYQTIEEVWFAGAHSDVGGGYEDSRAAEIPLTWMIERAERRGLRFRLPPPPAFNHDCSAPLHDESQFWPWRFLPSRQRLVLASDQIHESVRARTSLLGYQPAAKMP
jgi:uncharacterized protein (DUF2235 family)